MRLVLVEASPVLREEQRQRLAGADPMWVASLDEMPDGPLLLVANEFLDALPIRQLVQGERDWAERLVAVDAAGALVPRRRPGKPGAEPAGAAVAPRCSARHDRRNLPRRGDACRGRRRAAARASPARRCSSITAMPPPRPAPTLAAIEHHRATGILDRPGSADLSAHVDFAAFAEAARAGGADVYGPVPQGRFLAALGAEARLAALCAARQPGAARGARDAACRRLIDPAEMGTLFKVAGGDLAGSAGARRV